MSGSYEASFLPLESGAIDPVFFMEELIDATAKLEVYKEKIRDSKLDSSWFMPTLQQKEALASSTLEGTQATLDGVLIDQVAPNKKDSNLNEVRNYYLATVQGIDTLSRHDFSNDFFSDIHSALMIGNVRKPTVIGAYRTEQNYIGINDSSHAITFIPPVPEKVPTLMNNLIEYINNPQDSLRPLVRTAIIHAQFETIHPFMDGNGRVGRMLIPMYLYSQKQIDLPCFFISEALERDKIKYYNLLNNIRFKGEWNEWIKFFLGTVTKQCDKYIKIITDINILYQKHLNVACDLARTSKIVDFMNVLYQHPVTSATQIAEHVDIPQTSINRYLNLLVQEKILYTDNKRKNRTYYNYELLDILRA
ncbi:MAG: Fic family protein [Pseudobutyrivibrio sp.]|nr:Fic family protein [Pseudobutyrivibrio sp.]